MSFEFTIHENFFDNEGEELLDFIKEKGIDTETVLVAVSGFVSLSGLNCMTGVDEFKIKGTDKVYSVHKDIKGYWCFFMANEVNLCD